MSPERCLKTLPISHHLPIFKQEDAPLARHSPAALAQPGVHSALFGARHPSEHPGLIACPTHCSVPAWQIPALSECEQGTGQRALCISGVVQQAELRIKPSQGYQKAVNLPFKNDLGIDL